MLTVSELGSIEKGLDALGLPSGSYRDRGGIVTP